MPIQLTKISKHVNKLIKGKKGYEFPAWNITGENSFWLALLSGVRNSGKTNAVLQILNIEKKGMLQGDNVVYWISPTHDPKVVEVAEQYPDNMVFYDELTIATFREVIKKIEENISKWEQTKFIFDLLEKYLKKKDSVDESEMDILTESGLFDDDVDVKELISKFNFHHPPISTMVIDDSLGSPLISSGNSTQGKEATKFFIKHRHLYCNVLLLTQHFRGINKTIRSNTNAVMIFGSKDRSTLSSLYSEFSPLFLNKMENYEEALDLIDKKPFSFLFMYYDKAKFLRLNFDQAIHFTGASNTGGE